MDLSSDSEGEREHSVRVACFDSVQQLNEDAIRHAEDNSIRRANIRKRRSAD